MSEQTISSQAKDDRQAFYDAETRKVVEILKQANPERIIRFGSVARGTWGPDSDLDLCVLIDTDMPPFRVKQRLFKLLFAGRYRHPVSLDLHVYPPEEYHSRLAKGDPFLEEIERGEVVYARE